MVYYFVSSYLLLLCATPCMIKPLPEKSDACCSSASSNDQKDNSNENHGCNPLKNCSCSLSYSSDLPIFVLFKSSSRIFIKISYQQSFYSLFTTSIWQPPKIS